MQVKAFDQKNIPFNVLSPEAAKKAVAEIGAKAMEDSKKQPFPPLNKDIYTPKNQIKLNIEPSGLINTIKKHKVAAAAIAVAGALAIGVGAALGIKKAVQSKQAEKTEA